MKLPLLGRNLKIVLAAGFVLLSFIASFAAVNHGLDHVPPQPSARIMLTPGADESMAVATPVPAETETPADEISDAPQTFSLGRLLSKTVAVTSYTLKAKDNYWTIAENHHINLPTIIGANPTLPFKAYLGQTINLLSRRGTLHEVYPGETLQKIADAYRIEVKLIRQENQIHWWRGIRPGDVLFLPDIKPIRMSEQWQNYFDQRGFFGVPFTHGGEFITSGFGWRIDPVTGKRAIHTGLDFRAHYGESVFAAATGKVIFAGVDGGYGNLIKIHHNKEYTTYYAHLSKILVRRGEKVRRGQLIGKVGMTGYATGPHLHFEIRRYGKPINPLPLI